MGEFGYRFLSIPVAFALVCALVPGLSLNTAHGADRISGKARVVDGDTIDVGGRRIRLEGIDAPEAGQTCASRWLGRWKCGAAAAKTLTRLTAPGDVDCEIRGHDKYGRALGICQAAGREVNAEMVRSGHAWAFVKYSTTYVTVEREARAAKAGIWQAETEPAWVYRETHWHSAQGQAPNGCAIKGNVTERGPIYHMPWSPWYAKVRIETAKGERWFCSEAEAKQAGWRPAAYY